MKETNIQYVRMPTFVIEQIEEELSIEIPKDEFATILPSNEDAIDMSVIVDVMCNTIQEHTEMIRNDFEGSFKDEPDEHYKTDDTIARIRALAKITTWISGVFEYIDESPVDTTMFEIPDMQNVMIAIKDDGEN